MRFGGIVGRIGLVAWWLGIAAVTGPAGAAERYYACGDAQVREYQLADDGTVRETWRWNAADAADLPELYRTKLLRSIDECKPLDGGRSILVTTSTGGVVLLDRETGRSRFRAVAPMAHSAEILPGNRVAVALSTHPDGNRLEVYDLDRSETPLFHVELYSGHGVVWDVRRERLLALSHDWVQAFRLKDWDSPSPSLEEARRWPLPGEKRSGHDLTRDPVSDQYLVTTADAAYWLDPDADEADDAFRPFEPLHPAADVKALSLTEDRAVWVQAEESWWAHGFTVASRDGLNRRRVETPELRLYKVRPLR